MDLSLIKHTWLLDWLWRSHCGQYTCYITVSGGLLLLHACIATFRLVDRCVQRLFASRNTPLVGQCCIQLFALPSLLPLLAVARLVGASLLGGVRAWAGRLARSG
jgi:hypothetical protein